MYKRPVGRSITTSFTIQPSSGWRVTTMGCAWQRYQSEYLNGYLVRLPGRKIKEFAWRHLWMALKRGGGILMCIIPYPVFLGPSKKLANVLALPFWQKKMVFIWWNVAKIWWPYLWISKTGFDLCLMLRWIYSNPCFGASSLVIRGVSVRCTENGSNELNI